MIRAMIRIVALTEAGRRLGERIVALLTAAQLNDAQTNEIRLDYKPELFASTVQQAFRDKESLIMICATGIVVRTLAPVIQDKHQDPPVLVLDEAGRYVIPLLSGHEGGANQFAAEVAALIDAELVMTTANAYLKPVYTVGMGCERDCSAAEIAGLFHHSLQQAGIASDQVDSINSIDLKVDEVGLIALAQLFGKPLQVFDKTQLGEEEAGLSTRSDYVFATVGVYGVAESAALFAARQATGNPAELVLNKAKSARATCAIARSYPT